MRSFRAASVLFLGLAFGCESEVTVTTGGAGGSGDGGAPSTNSVGGFGGTPGTGGSTTSGFGGGSPCDVACEFAESCGLPGAACANYLDCSNEAGACVADCVNQPGVDCQMLFDAFQGNPSSLSLCVTGCQGSSDDCEGCAQNECLGAIAECAQAAGQDECQDWVACAQGCTDPDCLNGCTNSFPGGGVIQDCACSSCADQCEAVCDTGAGGGNAGGAGGAGGGSGGSTATGGAGGAGGAG